MILSHLRIAVNISTDHRPSFYGMTTRELYETRNRYNPNDALYFTYTCDKHVAKHTNAYRLLLIVVTAAKFSDGTAGKSIFCHTKFKIIKQIDFLSHCPFKY